MTLNFADGHATIGSIVNALKLIGTFPETCHHWQGPSQSSPIPTQLRTSRIPPPKPAPPLQSCATSLNPPTAHKHRTRDTHTTAVKNPRKRPRKTELRHPPPCALVHSNTTSCQTDARRASATDAEGKLEAFLLASKPKQGAAVMILLVLRFCPDLLGLVALPFLWLVYVTGFWMGKRGREGVQDGMNEVERKIP